MSGAAEDFTSFLQSRDRVFKLVPYIANRFNILLLHEMAALYYHRLDVTEVLKSMTGSNH